MNQKKMAALFNTQAPFLHYFLDQFDYEVALTLPDLYKHLKGEGVTAPIYVTEWLTTMYIYNFPIETASRVWDFFFYSEGAESLFRIGLSLLHIFKEQLMNYKFEEFLLDFKNKVSSVSAELLISRAMELTLSHETLSMLKDLDVDDYESNVTVDFGIDNTSLTLKKQSSPNSPDISELSRRKNMSTESDKSTTDVGQLNAVIQRFENRIIKLEREATKRQQAIEMLVEENKSLSSRLADLEIRDLLSKSSSLIMNGAHL